MAIARDIISNEEADKDEVDKAKYELEVALGELVASSGSEDNDNSNNNINGSENNSESNSGTNNKPGNNSGKGNGSLPKTGGTSAVAVGLLGLTALGGGAILSRKKK